MPNANPTITWDRNKLRRLKAAAALAEADGLAEFSFEGHRLVLAYAKYLIQYLGGNFEMNAPHDINLFAMGQIVATPGALDALAETDENASALLLRHAFGYHIALARGVLNDGLRHLLARAG